MPIGISSARAKESIKPVINDIFGIIGVAEYLQCVDAVAWQLENCLVHQGQMVWVSVAANPTAWAELGLRIKSELVFKEAVIHLVGRWPRLLYYASRVRSNYPAGEEALRKDEEYAYSVGLPDPRLPSTFDPRNQAKLEVSEADAHQAYKDIKYLRPEIRVLIHLKVRELEERKKTVNLRLMGFYPTFFSRAGVSHSMAPSHTTIASAIDYVGQQFAHVDTTGPNPQALGISVGPGSNTVRNTGTSVRASTYGKDVLGWMGLTLFRHWFGQYVLSLTSGIPNLDGGWAVYAAIERGGLAYLDHEALEGFVNWFPLSAKSRREFEIQVDRFKTELKGYVEDVMKDNLSLDRGKAAEVVRKSGKDPVAAFGRTPGVVMSDKSFRLEYLVCTEVKSEEMPWKLRRVVRDEQGNIQGYKTLKGGPSDDQDEDAGQEDVHYTASQPKGDIEMLPPPKLAQVGASPVPPIAGRKRGHGEQNSESPLAAVSNLDEDDDNPLAASAKNPHKRQMRTVDAADITEDEHRLDEAKQIADFLEVFTTGAAKDDHVASHSHEAVQTSETDGGKASGGHKRGGRAEDPSTPRTPQKDKHSPGSSRDSPMFITP